MFQDLLVQENRILRAKRDLRPNVENLEREVMPYWLILSDYPSRIKWALAIFFKLTPRADIIYQRIQQSDLIKIEDVADALALVYVSASEIINHDKNPETIVLEEEEWEL